MVLQQTPLAVTVRPQVHGSVIFPPLLAVVSVIPLAAVVLSSKVVTTVIELELADEEIEPSSADNVTISSPVVNLNPEKVATPLDGVGGVCDIVNVPEFDKIIELLTSLIPITQLFSIDVFGLINAFVPIILLFPI